MDSSSNRPRAMNSASPVKMISKTPKERTTQAKAELRQAIWEASQYCSTGDLDMYVNAVLREIEDDRA